MKSKRIAHPETQPYVRLGSLPHGTIELDELDRRIMKLLRHDGRLSYAHIARSVGISEPTVRKRIDRLVHAGADHQRGAHQSGAHRFPHRRDDRHQGGARSGEEVGRKLAEMENVAYVAYVAGSFDIIIEAFLPHTEGLFKFLNEDLDKIDGIASTETWNVLRTEKFFYNWEGEDVGLDPLPQRVVASRTATALRSCDQSRSRRPRGRRRVFVVLQITLLRLMSPRA